MAGPKLLVIHTSSNKAALASPVPFLGSSRRLLLLLLALFSCASLLTVFSSSRAPTGPAAAAHQATLSTVGAAEDVAGLPGHVFDALVHYAAAAGTTANSTAPGGMPEADVRAIASVLRRRAPCRLLVFGLGAETPLWRALNHGGRTVFLDENPYYVAHLEGAHPGLEAYDVAYPAVVARHDLPGLLAGPGCGPVQNLLFSECRLAVNDLPNQLYDVAWDVILVDGPREGSPAGRMAAIFSAAVMARTRGEAAGTEVLVHDYEREAERACGREFLCEENRVAGAGTPSLGHFLVRSGAAVNREAFCGPPQAQSAAH